MPQNWCFCPKLPSSLGEVLEISNLELWTLSFVGLEKGKGVLASLIRCRAGSQRGLCLKNMLDGSQHAQRMYPLLPILDT